jgi:DNA ligase D-like protein (predicted ligase)
MNPIKPMLAISGKPFTTQGWIFEPKIDGTRCIAHISKDGVMLQNRRLVDITYRYPELETALAGSGDLILDGEISVFFEGRPDFSALAMREHQLHTMRIDYLSKADPASYIVFDILGVDGKTIIETPLSERKKILKEELPEDKLISIIDYFPRNGEAYYKAAVMMGLEGIMGKREASVYRPGIRSSDWIKIKKSLTVDLVVGGYIQGKGNREAHFGGLLVGAYDSEKLIYVGRVGSGFSEKELELITESFVSALKSPFSNPPSTPGIIWLKPNMVVEVTAMEVTHNGHLRAPVFVRLRDDKEPKDCLLEQIRARDLSKGGLVYYKKR